MSGRIWMIDVVRQPARLREATEEQWATLLGQADQARLLGRLVQEADHVVPDPAPRWLRDRLASARALARECERAVAWEVRRIGRAFYGAPWRWVLLKGAGYVAAGLPPAVGRRVADIDVLVPQDSLDEAAAALEAQGWQFPAIAEYDERYYRQWMHELPPMVHDVRGSIVDLHHAILPRTSRLTADSRVLIERARAFEAGHVLCPSHMVIHAAVHLFHDGEIAGAVRDLVDLDGLLRHFTAHEADFWPTLLKDSADLGLERPVFYSLRYASRLLATPIPPEVVTALNRSAPAGPVLVLMDALVERTLAGHGGSTDKMAAFGLFARSHWLRMPPLLLARHLMHKLARQ